MIYNTKPFYKIGSEKHQLNEDDARAIVETNNNNNKALLKRQPYQKYALVFQELKDYAIIDNKVYSVKPDIPEIGVFNSINKGVN